MSAAGLTLSPDEIDDVLYFTRINDAAELQQTLTDLASKHTASLKAVLEASIDPVSGNTVLHYCSANGFTDLLPSLLALPGDLKLSAQFVNFGNREGNTALHWAAYNGHLEIVKLLTAAGANMWAKNAAGHLAMFEAERADKNDVVQYLLETGGDEVEATGEEGQASAEDVAEVQADGTNASAVTG